MDEKQISKDENVRICELSSEEDSARIRELTSVPQYMCFGCGRVANEKENLCSPQAFSDLEIDPIGLE